MAYLSGDARLLDRRLVEAIVAIAGSYGLSGPAAPDLFGKQPGEATQAAQRAGFTLQFSGEEIDSQIPSGSVLLQNPPAGSAGIGSQIDVILSVSPSPICSINQLALDYYGGGAGAGNDFGTIEIRDTSDQPCLLHGPIELTGVDRSGAPVTQTLEYSVEPSLVLAAGAPHRSPGQDVRFGQVVGELPIAAEYRDDPTSPNGLCNNQVIPASWRLAFLQGSTMVANASSGPAAPNFSSLLTCRGQLDTPEPVTARG